MYETEGTIPQIKATQQQVRGTEQQTGEPHRRPREPNLRQGNHTADQGSHTADQGNHTADQGSHTADQGNHTADHGSRASDSDTADTACLFVYWDFTARRKQVQFAPTCLTWEHQGAGRHGSHRQTGGVAAVRWVNSFAETIQPSTLDSARPAAVHT